MEPQTIQRQVNDEERAIAPTLNIPANINIGEVGNIPINREENHEIPFEAPTDIDKAAVTSMTAEDLGNCTIIRGLDFYGYQNLETIELPSSVTKIEQFAFAKLPKLKEVIIPDGEIKIDGYAFFSCKNLINVRLPQGLKEIKTGTFSDCKNLSTLKIPNSVTKIEDFAFFGCSDSFKAIDVPQKAKVGSRAFPKGKKSYTRKKAKPLRCCFKKRRKDEIIVNPPIIENNQNLNDFYNDGLGANVNEPNPDMGNEMGLAGAIPVANVNVPYVLEPVIPERAIAGAPINQNEAVAGSSSPEFDIANELDNLYIVAGCNEHWMLNANRGNVVDNTRVEVDKNLLNRLENLYMIDALNISTPYIYNQSRLTEKFRLYDGNRTEMTVEKDNGVERIKHNVDKGEGSSNMMRILYPSSAGTLAIEGGYEEAFKKDCAPTPELMGEIVAHLYKYRKNKDISIRNKFDSQDSDSQILKSISAYISAKNEVNSQTGEITKGATEQRNEIKSNLVGKRLENQSVLAKLKETFENKPRNIAVLNNLKNIPQDIEEIRGDQNRDDRTKYNDIMSLIEKKEAALKEKKITKKEFANYGIIKGKLEMKIEEADIQAIEKNLGFIIDRNIVKIGKKFSEPINAYKDRLKADEEKEEKVKKIIPKVGSILMEFPSLQFIGKESLTTFIALIKNAEAMIDQESESSEKVDEKEEKRPPMAENKGIYKEVILKYTTERMLMTYVLKEFGNTSSLNKFYDKVQNVIPKRERKDAKEDAYEKKLNVLDKTRQFFEALGAADNVNSPYEEKAFGYAYAAKFHLAKDENGDNINAKTGGDFPDCADTASRHLINLLSYDKENKWKFIYDEENEEEVAKLEAISNKVLGAIKGNKEIVYDNLADRVKAFYYYQNKQGVDNREETGHTFWNYVISNMNAVHKKDNTYYDIKYNRSDNELLPGYINFLKLAYNIAYALKAGQGLTTANDIAYDDQEGKEGQLTKAKNAIDALDVNYVNNIEKLKPLLRTAITEVFYLYNKELQDVKFAELMKGGRAGNDIVGRGETELKINRAKNQKDSLDFEMLMCEGHAETHHDPSSNHLTDKQKRDYANINPQLMLLPGMYSDADGLNELSTFDRLFTSDTRKAIEWREYRSDLYNKFALQSIIDVVEDEGFLSTIDTVKVLKLIADNKGSIKLNRINKSRDKNGKEIVTQEELIDFADYLETKFANTIKQNCDTVVRFIKDLNSSSEDVMDTPKYKNVVDEIFKGAGSIYQDGEDYYCCKLENDKAKIIDVASKNRDIKPPKEVELNGNKYPVNSVSFVNNKRLQSVEIPNSVTAIVYGAFYFCKGLKRVIIPNSVKFIEDYAFQGCSKLVEVNIPNSVDSIKKGAFSGCESLKDIVIPESVKTIESEVFSKCANLKNINIPSGVTEISNIIFCDCSRLERITLPDSLTSIGISAFADCKRLRAINIPNNVTKIKSSAFARCRSLGDVVIPDGVKVIERYTFENSNIESLIIPNSVDDIENDAFRDCDVKKIELPLNLKELIDMRSSDLSGTCGLHLYEYKVKKLKNNRVRLTKKNN